MTFRTRFGGGDSELTTQEFETKEDNDAFARGLELLSMKVIIKEYWQPHMKEWFRYHRE